MSRSPVVQILGHGPESLYVVYMNGGHPPWVADCLVAGKAGCRTENRRSVSARRRNDPRATGTAAAGS